MSYRDDLDAAHARIAALEAENEHLRRELDALRAQKPRVLVEPPVDSAKLRATRTISIVESHWNELATLQAEIVSTSDKVELARLMRRMAELHDKYLHNPDTARRLRKHADEIDPH